MPANGCLLTTTDTPLRPVATVVQRIWVNSMEVKLFCATLSFFNKTNEVSFLQCNKNCGLCVQMEQWISNNLLLCNGNFTLKYWNINLYLFIINHQLKMVSSRVHKYKVVQKRSILMSRWASFWMRNYVFLTFLIFHFKSFFLKATTWIFQGTSI